VHPEVCIAAVPIAEHREVAGIVVEGLPEVVGEEVEDDNDSS
jgi:hypothetical protein